eukprot:CAMPEP_0194046972 /NCGR_PEP_ID=MMETSP0009_2-20130614/23239_1 /TAXON_ID=210454 /ORGANISM="Grammatophora oceanica, Strain CCMP 410" /LENGTH=376 /DNA_ID=CAMNT_0038692463 /DNA_START=167 /DNA_END=1294 /DNA_ORIENTATION=+
MSLSPAFDQQLPLPPRPESSYSPSPRIRKPRRKRSDQLLPPNCAIQLGGLLFRSDNDDNEGVIRNSASADFSVRANFRREQRFPVPLAETKRLRPLITARIEPLVQSTTKFPRSSSMTSMAHVALPRQETLATQALQEALGCHVHKIPETAAVTCMDVETEPPGMHVLQVGSLQTSAIDMPKSVSAPLLNSLVHIQGSANVLTKKDDVYANTEYAGLNPVDYLKGILTNDFGIAFESVRSLDIQSFFLKATDAHVAAYTPDLISAVRREDVAELRRLMNAGVLLQACNKFGESILHMACRRGSTKVVEFLLNEASVDVRVCDDYGRSALHDSFWTREPSVELVQLILGKCPDLLIVQDKRCFTPLNYARRDDWALW